MTVQQCDMTDRVVLPVDLAPAQVNRVLNLLAEVHITVAPDLVIELPRYENRCVVCHQSGKLGGHHGADGRIQWIHRACHRRLHRSGRHQVAVLPRQRGVRYAC